MKTIKSLDQLIKLTEGAEQTAQELINRNVFTKNKGWTDIKLSAEFAIEIATSLASLYGGINRTKANVRDNIINERPQHWGLQRTLIVKRNNQPAKFEYVSGQDGSSEKKIIRKYLSK